MATDLAPLLRPRRAPQADSGTHLITCSLCLRVRRGSEWLGAEDVIREIRSYELAAPPRLHPGVCDVCAESILSRRMQAAEPTAA
jgi:hypothetical protein